MIYYCVGEQISEIDMLQEGQVRNINLSLIIQEKLFWIIKLENNAQYH